MSSPILKWIIVAIAAINFGYMLVDGARALIVGDYFRPSSGEYAGKLGPWTGLVSKLGLDPEGATMRSVFLIFGLIGLSLTIAFAFGRVPPQVMLAACLLSIWNLYVGTMASVVMIALLLIFIFS